MSDLVTSVEFDNAVENNFIHDEFDFDNPENGMKVLRYKDLKTRITEKKSLYNADYVSLFGLYGGIKNIKKLAVGDIVTGVISAITTKEVIIDINNKDTVRIDRKSSEDKICKLLTVGNEIDVLIISLSENPYLIKGSVAELLKRNVEKKIVYNFENNIAIEAYVRDMIPAGFLLDVDVDGMTMDCFMPNTLADVNRLFDTKSLLHTKINVMIETLQQDKDKGVYVLSRKKYLKSLIPEKVEYLKSQPKNKVYTGKVTGVKDYGVYVQFEDCLTGMIYKPNISESVRDNLMDIKPGTIIDFYVKDIIKNGSQIILSQYLRKTLWDTIRVGDKLTGKIISVKQFGVLISLDEDTNGLIQHTYLVKNPNKKLKDGDSIDVVVISIIRDERKIYLTFADDNESLSKLREKSDELEKLKQKFNTKF